MNIAPALPPPPPRPPDPMIKLRDEFALEIVKKMMIVLGRSTTEEVIDALRLAYRFADAALAGRDNIDVPNTPGTSY